MFSREKNVVITVFTVFRLLTDFVCLYNYEFLLSLCKIVRSSVNLLLPLFIYLNLHFFLIGSVLSTNKRFHTVAVNFIGEGNKSTWRKPPICRKSLTNLITKCCIECISPWTGLILMIGTACTGAWCLILLSKHTDIRVSSGVPLSLILSHWSVLDTDIVY